MRGREEYVKKEDLKVGKRYEVDARNFSTAVWTGYAFVGKRTKFGMVFDDEEFHWDDGPPHGTVKPIKELEDE